MAAIAVTAALGAAAGAHGATRDPAIPSPPTRASAWVAHITHPTVARSAPSPGARRVATVGTRAPWTGGPLRLLVLGARRDDRGDIWLRVRLAQRPNTASGWIPGRFAELERTPWRVVVDRSSRTVTVLRAGRTVRRMAAVVGTGATPTPTGLFAILKHARQGAGAPLGPWALHLTAHSPVLRDYAGGTGRVAIHGRAGAIARAPLGSAASHGCVRVDNAVIAWMARRLAPGTPVEVRR